MAQSRIIVGLGEVLWDLLPSGKQLGGAPANFAFHSRSLGAAGVVASRVGDDPSGRQILDLLNTEGLKTSLVQIDAAHPTGTVDVVLDAAGVPAYVINEPVAWDFLSMAPDWRETAAQCDAVCFGSLAQRSEVSRHTIIEFLDATMAICLRVFDINLRQHFFSRAVIDESLRRATLLKLNDQELPVLVELLGIHQNSDADRISALFQRYPLQFIALTRGERGSLLCSHESSSAHPGFPAARIVDTVGAGDAFTAALVAGLLDGHELERINVFANRLAGYVCTQPGAMPALPAELLAIR